MQLKYRYGFNGMERDDEMKGIGNSYDFGARLYDPRLGKFFGLDPRYKDVPSWSHYSFAADNPIVFIDFNGEIFRIYYRDSKGRRRKFDFDGTNASDAPNNAFVQDVIASYMYIVKNEADISAVLSTLASSDIISEVVRGMGDETFYHPESGMIFYNPRRVLKPSIFSKKRQSPAIGFFHEAVHRFNALFTPMIKYINENTKDEDYDDLEEKDVVDNYETPAVIILQEKGFPESVRHDHDGITMINFSPTPEAKMKRQEKRQQKKEQKKRAKKTGK